MCPLFLVRPNLMTALHLIGAIASVLLAEGVVRVHTGDALSIGYGILSQASNWINLRPLRLQSADLG